MKSVSTARMDPDIPDNTGDADEPPPVGGNGVALPPAHRGGLVSALFKAIRPKQATKNLFVYTALVFAGQMFRSVPFLRVTLAFFLFTLISGSIYILNDILDVEQDRQHPRKRNRPFASGQLSLRVGWIAMTVLMGIGLTASFVLSVRFGVVVATYLGLQIAYCLSLKHVVLLDIFVIACGFVLRTVAGGMVIRVPISHWLLLCSLQLALFLGFFKRRQELVLLGEEAAKHRAILQEYSLPFLDQMITIVAGVTVVCYSVYAIESQTARQHPHLWITIPLVIFSVCRYMYLVYQKGWGGAPEEALLKDRTLQVAIGLWLALVILLFAFDKTGNLLFLT